MSHEKRQAIRRDNLLFLIETAGGGTQAGLGRRLDMDPSMFSQVKNGTRGMGEELARDIEQAMGLKEYSMDRPLDGDLDKYADPGIDANKLAIVIEQFYKALDGINGELDAKLISKLIAGTYRHFSEGNELPDFAQLVRGAMLASDKG